MPLISTAIYASDGYVCVCVCVCKYVYACGFQAVICSILFFTFHLYGIFRSVAPHLLLSHLTHSLEMVVCVSVCVFVSVCVVLSCVCAYLRLDTCLYILVCLPGYLCHSPFLSCQCAVSGKIVG